MMVHTLDGIWSYIRPRVMQLLASVSGGVTIRKNSGADVGTRPRLNLIEGTNITLTVIDDAGSNEVDITIAAAGGSVSAPVTGNYATGSFTIATGQFGLQGHHLILATTERGTVAGTGRLSIYN